MAKHEQRTRKPSSHVGEGKSPSPASTHAPVSSLLDLQRASGNEATGRVIGGMLVQAKRRGAADVETPPPTGTVEPSSRPAADRELEPAVETSRDEPAAMVVVDDSTETPAPGQMKKSEFLARLRAEVCAAAEAGLAGTEHSAQGCPLIEFWLGRYEAEGVDRINRDLPRFAGEGPRPTTAEGYVALIAARVRTSVETWARTGEITGVPPGIPLPGMGLPGLGALGGLAGGVGDFTGGLGGLGGIFFKANSGGPRDPGDPRDLRDQLGEGRPLDGAVRSRMESALGRSFARVRVHDDGSAASLASRLDAKAFTVGEHVAFAPHKYRPGTLAGDALLAHELAHVAQQANGDAAAAAAGAAGYQPLERDADLAAAAATMSLWGGRQSLRPAPRLASGLRLQRCRSCAQTHEEKQVEGAVPQQILAGSGFDRFLPAFEQALAGAGDLAAAQQVVDDHGHELWRVATQRAQTATGANTDDRPLYWARLQLTRALRRWEPSFSLNDTDREALIQRLERTSRGMDTARFPGTAGNKRILISGFDPFQLGPDPSRGNPSGAAVLALDGTQVKNGSVTGDVEGVVFPVRFADFDAGVVEGFFGPWLSTPNAVDMVMTISQGGDATEVERFAGRGRSTPASDNLGVLTGGTPTAPVEPGGLRPGGPEFLTSGLEETPPGGGLSPADRIRGELGRSAPLSGETEFTQLPAAPAGATQPTPGARAVEGSGGGYLSNEIFYRTSLLRRQNKSTIPLGHLHVRALRPETGYRTPGLFAAARDAIVATVKRILEAVLPGL
ncbi:MAG TPA: DUF4157 domain-containing protein [Thermoanaerobaculia bacterium]|jgi:pyrrolidone-carboxylate peptidase|nr:DUF4157 domain-containing protein [Thermoanaerobaculia bacterium]